MSQSFPRVIPSLVILLIWSLLSSCEGGSVINSKRSSKASTYDEPSLHFFTSYSRQSYIDQANPLLKINQNNLTTVLSDFNGCDFGFADADSNTLLLDYHSENKETYFDLSESRSTDLTIERLEVRWSGSLVRLSAVDSQGVLIGVVAEHRFDSNPAVLGRSDFKVRMSRNSSNICEFVADFRELTFDGLTERTEVMPHYGHFVTEDVQPETDLQAFIKAGAFVGKACKESVYGAVA